MKNKTILIILSVQVCLAYRLAWRPDTKVFPYASFPEASRIDNGDNNGRFINETVFKQP